MAEMRSAAIFDLDGTLIPHTSAEKTFFFHLLRNGGMNIWNILQMLPAIWKAKGNIHDMARTNKGYLRNKSAQKFENIAHRYFEPRIDVIVFPEMREIIEMHRKRGELLLLLTGTLDVIAGCFVRHLHLDGYKAGTLEIQDGKYTGRINGILPYGMGKLEVLRDLWDEYKFDRNKTVLYANIFSDRYVMNAVHDPVAVNPDSKLRSYAQKLGWKIMDMEKRPTLAT